MYWVGLPPGLGNRVGRRAGEGRGVHTRENRCGKVLLLGSGGSGRGRGGRSRREGMEPVKHHPMYSPAKSVHDVYNMAADFPCRVNRHHQHRLSTHRPAKLWNHWIY